MPTIPPAQADPAALLSAALETIPHGFCVWDSELRLVAWNRRYLELYRFPDGAIRCGQTLDEVVALSVELGNHPGQSAREFTSAYVAELVANRGGARATTRERLWGSRTIETTHVFTAGLGWVVTHRDVTDEIAAENMAKAGRQALERESLRLDAAVNNISQGLCMFDAAGRLVISNAPYARIYGLPPRLVEPGTQLDDILEHLFAHGMTAFADRTSYMSWRKGIIAEGRYVKAIHELRGRTIMMQHHPMQDGGWVSTHEDITEQRQQEERIRHLARHDVLTELPNRRSFIDRMSEVESALGRGETMAVVLIDIDNFKTVNDTFGNTTGDKLLKQASARLWGATRENDHLARLAADQFVLLVREINGPEEAAAAAERIVRTMASPFHIEGQPLDVTASVGIAMAPADGVTADALMQQAELALESAKATRRGGFHFFEIGMDTAVRHRRAIEHGLRQALQRSELRLMYQPLFDLRQSRVAAFEALLRWDSEGRPVPPAEFIPIAEDCGLIDTIGEWVLDQACRTAVTWPGDIRIAVNLSPVQLRNPALYDIVRNALTRAGLDPSRLELEITESTLLDDDEATLLTLHRLRKSGIRISLDDFGTGYSSLSYLRSFPFDKIKIDRSFTRDLARGGNLAIVKAVIGLGHSLGMITTAEGVETEDQVRAIRDQGCDEVQGFYFSPPLSPSAARQLLEAAGTSTAPIVPAPARP